MATYLENCRSICLSEGIDCVRIYIVQENGEHVEFITEGNKYKQIKH